MEVLPDLTLWKPSGITPAIVRATPPESLR